MIQINKHKIGDYISFIIPLESEMKITGLLKPIKSAPPNVWLTGNAFISGQMHYEGSSRYSAITALYLNKNVYAGKDVTDLLLTFELGDYITLTETNSSEFGKYRISNTPVMNNGVLYAKVEFIDGNGDNSGGTYIIVTLKKNILVLGAGGNELPEPEPILMGTITGYTSSKLSYIVKSFPLEQVTDQPIIIRGTEMIGQITSLLDADEVTYNIRLDDDIVIYYKDVNGVTIFSFLPSYILEYSDDISFLLKYLILVDEPKLDSNLFINRGVNNVFESFRRLKTVANIQEMEKTGLGYYKMVSDGMR